MSQDEQELQTFVQHHIEKTKETLRNTALGILDAIDTMDENNMESAALQVENLRDSLSYNILALKAFAKVEERKHDR